METFPWKRIVAVDDVEEALISSFTCGDEAMDGWFLNRALSWCYLGFCQVYIALDDEGVVGFLSLSPTQIEPMAVRQNAQGKEQYGASGPAAWEDRRTRGASGYRRSCRVAFAGARSLPCGCDFQGCGRKVHSA